MHLPRSVFSQRQLDLFLWLLKVNKVDDVPSVKTMKAMNELLQNFCGIDTTAHNGVLGHRYYVNNLSQILAQVSIYFPVILTSSNVYIPHLLGNLQSSSPTPSRLLSRGFRNETQ